MRGISPVEIKAGAKHHIPNPDADQVRHRHCLNVIVNRLGFAGDFGDFQNRGWAAFLDFLKRHACTHRVGVFPADHGGCIDLYFSERGGPRPRELADRVFAQQTFPKRVFLGYGVDWTAWDNGNGITAPAKAIATIKGDFETAAQRAAELFACRHEFPGQWGFLDEKLVHGPVNIIVDKTYWQQGSTSDERSDHAEKVTAAVKAFRAVFDTQPEGWVEVLRYNDRLVVLKTHDGGWDLLWKNYREEEPPQPIAIGRSFNLAVEDLPACLMSESDRRRAVHFRQDVWAEWEAHQSEQAFYDRGGSILARQMASSAEVLLAWLHEQGSLPLAERVHLEGAIPSGFQIVDVAGRKIAVNGMINLHSFRQMLVETGYGARRHNSAEAWDRANDGVSGEMPAGATWADAQAFCAWKEREIGVALRLPTREELRAIRPAYSQHYDRLATRDFPWEDFPPRPLAADDSSKQKKEVPTAVLWSEPRFDEPQHDLPEFPADSGLATTSRKRWITDFPPRAAWKIPMPLHQHQGLDFIDAWDA